MQIAASLPKRAVAFFSAAVLAVSMVCAVPFTAQAAEDVPESSGYTGTIKATGQTAEVTLGETITMTTGEGSGVQFKLTPTGDTTAAHHIDYEVTATGDGGAATINKHSGVLTPSAAGTVTVTAYLLDCAQPSQVSGVPCYGTERVIDQATKTVTINPATTSDYGWQGNALQIKLADSYNVMVDPSSTDTAYVNNVSNISAVDGVITIAYSQNYGTGNDLDNFASKNASKITLKNSAGQTVRSLGTDMMLQQPDQNVKTDLTVSFSTAGLDAGTYTLVFDPTYVAGNGTSELGASVSFVFTI